MPTGPEHVLVIGAGTGGLCLAHGLRRAGISVAVYERHRTRTEGLHGYRVGIDPDGSRALHACLPPELYDTFVATAARTPKYFNILTERLAEVLSLGDGPEDPEPADPINSEKSVSRITLRQVLLTGLEDIVHFDKTFTHFDRHGDGSVTAHFADGTSATGSVLVGADGTSSAVRTQYLPQARLEESGLLSIAGKMELTPQTKALLTPKMFDGVSMVFAPRGFMCIYHVMEFKWDREGTVKRGIGDNDAALIAAWPGLLYDNTRDYVMWGFGGATARFPEDLPLMASADLLRMVQQMTGRWHPKLRRLFSLTDVSTVFAGSIKTSVPIPQWETTNVTLIGDAIHTMTPGRGVGANTALRDARLLCRNLAAAKDGRMTVREAIRGYETQMVDYGFEAVVASRKQMDGGDLIHRPVVGRLVLAGMRTGMRAVNHLPPVKRRMLESQERYRGHNRQDED